MAKYVYRKHGLVIGSGDYFSYRDQDQKLQTFPALVWARNYTFTEISTANCDVRTPAHQLMFEYAEFTASRTFDGEEQSYPVYRFVPSVLMTQWCNENTPGWGTAPVKVGIGDIPERNPGFFFQKRAYALAFVQFIEHLLAGMEFL